MPRFEWKEEDTAKSLAFFPLVGVVIAAAFVLLNGIRPMADWPTAVRVLLSLLIPTAVSGGIHLDGFLDVEDALHSFGDTEKKLEILKDPHIGAFAVIGLVKWLLLFAAAVTTILLSPKCDLKVLCVTGLVFVASRALSSLTSLLIPKARKSGMLVEETQRSGRGMVASAIIWLGLCFCLMLYLYPVLAIILAFVFVILTLWYRYGICKSFGGVTGDTAGFFLTITEIIGCGAVALTLLLTA